MEIVKVAELIQEDIRKLKDGNHWRAIQALISKKAETEAEYDKSIAVTLIRLKNGGEFDLEGKKIADPPVTIMEKLARGICWKEKQAMTLADAEYKLTVEKLRCIQACLSGNQSILRYFETLATDEYNERK